eukprot:2712282-Pleurochrysis_carterae.AAC.1
MPSLLVGRSGSHRRVFLTVRARLHRRLFPFKKAVRERQQAQAHVLISQARQLLGRPLLMANIQP